MGRWTKADRDKLHESDFGDPERRLFPIMDQDDVDSAARLIGKAQNPEAVKKRIKQIAKRKKLKVPEAWEKATADMSAGLATAEFSTEDKGTPGTTAAKTVVRKAGVIFRAGDYPFKDAPNYSMSPEEIMGAVADFKEPVPLEMEHAPSVLDGKLGKVTKLTPSADYSEFGGEVEVPSWLDGLFPGQPIPLSARWDRGTKRLVKVGIVRTPRVDDAAMSAAFAKAEGDKAAADAQDATGVESRTGGRESGNGNGKMDTSKKTPHGQKLLQYIHDMTAVHGACCSESHAPLLKASEKGNASPLHANFHAAHEQNTVQQIHDLTLGSGAACAIYKDNLGKNKVWRPGQEYMTSVEQMPHYREYRPGQYAVMNADGTPHPDALAAFQAAGGTAAFGGGPDPRVAELERQLAAERTRNEAGERLRWQTEAALFASQVIQDNRALPAKRRSIELEYVRACEDDRKAGGTVTFADEGGRERVGTRVDALRSHYAGQPQHQLREELLSPHNAYQALPNQATTPGAFAAGQGGADPYAADRKAVEEYVERRNAQIRREDRKDRVRRN